MEQKENMKLGGGGGGGHEWEGGGGGSGWGGGGHRKPNRALSREPHSCRTAF